MSLWQTFFDHHAPVYMQNSFTRNTQAEVDFLLEELRLPPGGTVLDVGCGTGRHSVALAQRGYKVTGVDLSAGMLAEARAAAQAAGVTVEWIQADATRFTASRLYDAVICLCEGAFGLIDSAADADTHDAAILGNIYAALKPGGRFLLTALNGLRAIRQFTQADVEAGRFDPLTLVETEVMEYATPDGPRSVAVREKKNLPQDLARLCQQAGLEVEHLWGGTAGDWGRRPIKLDEMEVMIVAWRPEH